MFQSTRLLFLVATFFCGLAFAFMYPLISLYLVDELGNSPLQMGLFLATMVTTGVLVSTFIGKKSDQNWRRKNIIVVAQVCFSLAMLVFIFTRHFYYSLAAAAFLLSVSSSTLPQIFTLGRMYADKKISDGSSLFMSLMRAGIAVAWVVGPPLAFIAKEQVGYNFAFSLSIGSALLMLVIVLLLPEYRAEHLSAQPVTEKTFTEKQADHQEQQKQTGTVPWSRNPSVVLFLLSTALMFSASHMYVNSIPLYITKELFFGSQWAGYLMGLAAFIEIPFMILAGIYGPRVGNKKLMCVALVSGALFFVGVLLVDSVAALLALQLLNGIFVAITACLGMLLIQDLMKTQMGLATTLFSSAQQVSMLVGSLCVGVVAQFVSYYAVYIVCVVVLILSLALLLFVKEVRPKQKPDTLAIESLAVS